MLTHMYIHTVAVCECADYLVVASDTSGLALNSCIA